MFKLAGYEAVYQRDLTALHKRDMDINDIINRNKEALSERDRYANKGTYGKLLVIGGSRGMAGAAYLCSLAAFRTGIGMVKVFGPECNRVILQTALPEAMYQSMEPEDIYSAGGISRRCGSDKGVDMDAAASGHGTAQYQLHDETADTPDRYADIDIRALTDSLDWADIVVMGPGLSKSDKAVKLMSLIGSEEVSHRLRDKQLVVYDADALNIISAFIHGDKSSSDIAVSLFGQCGNTVITPHIGEMSRMTGLDIAYIKEHQSETAADFSRRFGVTVVLKDAVTVVAEASTNDDKGADSDANENENSIVNADANVNADAGANTYVNVNTDANINVSTDINVNADADVNINADSDSEVPKIEVFTIDSGCGAMAKAGSGDVLCGFIAGITAVLKGAVSDSIPAAVYLHGRAGSIAAEKQGCHSILAEDIANSAAAAMRV